MNYPNLIFELFPNDRQVVFYSIETDNTKKSIQKLRSFELLFIIQEQIKKNVNELTEPNYTTIPLLVYIKCSYKLSYATIPNYQ